MLEWLAGGGWHVAARGEQGGLRAHRGVLHPDEFVNMVRLVPAVERRLGFTLDALHAAYRQGRTSAAQRELRDRVDRRLLEVADAGGNLSALARVTGVHEHTFQRALRRARAAV